MKNKKTVLFFIAAVLFACVFSFSVAASTDIEGHNLALEDHVEIIYYVYDTAPENAETGVLFWLTPQANYAYGSETYKVTASFGEIVNPGTGHTCRKYAFAELSAKMMTDDVYAVSYSKVGENITYSEPDKYSVLQYAFNKKNSAATLPGGTATLGEVVSAILNYGAAAQRYFGYKTDRLANATYYQVTVVNGTLADGTVSGLYAAGDTVALRAEATRNDLPFARFENSARATVGVQTTLNVVAGAADETYTAVYAEESAPVSVGLAYMINGDGETCTITGIGTCEDTELAIPTAVDGYAVTGIGNAAFDGCTGLTSITIPDGVTSIGEWAFYDCTNLTSITIPDSVTSIGLSAFYNCTGLTSITIPDSVTSIGNDAFYNCTGLTSFTIGSGVTSIGDGAFSRCTGLTSVTIPDGVTSIGGYAFQYCTGLTNVTIGSGVTSIGQSAFSGCTGLTSITIGSGVTSIPNGLLSGCSSLVSITIPFVGSAAGKTANDTYQYPFGYIFGTSSYTGGTATRQYYYGSSTSSTTSTTYYIPTTLRSVTVTGGNILRGAFYGCKGLTSVTIPDGVTSIGSYAFYGCTDLTSVTIPDSVTSIGSYAFYECTSLTSITIPEDTTSIGDRAFRYCSGLTSITVAEGNPVYHSAGNCLIETASKTLIQGCNTSVIPTDGSVTSISEYAFYGCTGLTSVTIPDGVTSIGGSVFRGCTGLTSITIPDSVTSIGSYAFSSCRGLISITIPDSVTSIGQLAFSNCTRLTAVYITDLAKWCGITFAYADSNPLCYAHNLYVNGVLVTKLVIPEGVTSIGNYAFDGCTSLTSITIPDSVTSIGQYAFRNCTANVVWGDAPAITTLGQYAFYGYSGPSITIPDSVTSIGGSAFYGCTGLTSITIPDSVTSIGDRAFQNCYKLVEVYNRSALTITQGSSDNGYVGYYAKAIYTAPYVSKLSTDENGYILYTDGETKSLIGYTGTDTVLTLPGGITEINQYAFYGCTGLTSIIIPDGVTSIGRYAFYYRTELTSITISDSVASIGVYAFSYCRAEIVWGDTPGITTIGQYAFSGYTGTSITIPDSVTSIGRWAFEDCTRLTAVYITDVAKWCGISFGNATANPLYYAHDLYVNGVLVTELAIPNSVTSIGESAFYNCTGLTSITIPDSVTSIGHDAFKGCTGLTSVTIPEGVTSIGEGAFSGCSSLVSMTIPFVGGTAGKTANDTDQYPFGYIFGTSSYTGGTATTQYYYGSSTSSMTSTTYSIPTTLRSVTVTGGNILYGAFYNCTGLTSITIPDSVTEIGQAAFSHCTGLTSINFTGTKAQWNAISKGSSWNTDTGNYTVHCIDGDIAKADS